MLKAMDSQTLAGCLKQPRDSLTQSRGMKNPQRLSASAQAGSRLAYNTAFGCRHELGACVTIAEAEIQRLGSALLCRSA